MKGFATIGIAGALAISAGLGYFLAVVRNDTPPSSARKPLTENTSAKADAREIELPVAEASPLFRSHLAFLEKINAADFEELWNLWEDPNTNLLNHNDILDRLIDLDPIQLSDRLRTSGDQKKMSSVMQLWALKDPIAAYRHTAALPHFDVPGGHYRDYVHDRALGEAMKTGNTELTLELLGHKTRIGDGIFATASAKSVRWFLDLLVEKNYLHPCMDTAFAAFANNDYKAAAEWAEMNQHRSNGKWEQQLTSAALTDNFDVGLKRALEYFKIHPSDLGFLSKLASEVAEESPQRSIELIEKLATDATESERQNLAESVIYRVPAVQRPAVVAELEQCGLYSAPPATPQWPLPSEDALLDVLTLETPSAADSQNLRLFKLPVPAIRAAEIIATRDPATISPSMVNAVAHHLTNEDPVAALEWAAGLDDSLSFSTASSVIERWVTIDSEAAMAYAIQLPNSEFQTAAASAIVKQRAALDGAATREWVENLDPGSFGDSATQIYISSVKGDTLLDLIPLATKINDDARRREALLHILDQSTDETSHQLIENPTVVPADRAFLEITRF